MNTMLKMKIVLRPSGKTLESGPDLNQGVKAASGAGTVPVGLRHVGAAEEAQESLRRLARQRVVQTRVRRLKRVAWVLAGGALVWGIVVASRKPDGAVAGASPPVVVALSRAAVESPAAKPAADPVAAVAVPARSANPAGAVAMVAAPGAGLALPAAPVRPTGILEGPANPAQEAGAAAGAPVERCESDFGQGRWRSAIESCGAAFAENPGAPLALKIAHANWSSGKVERAGSWARKAVELGTQDADAFVLIGHSERQSGDVAGAMAAYRRYLRWSPRGWHARDVRAALRELKAKAALEAEAAAAVPAPPKTM